MAKREEERGRAALEADPGRDNDDGDNHAVIGWPVPIYVRRSHAMSDGLRKQLTTRARRGNRPCVTDVCQLA